MTPADVSWHEQHDDLPSTVTEVLMLIGQPFQERDDGVQGLAFRHYRRGGRDPFRPAFEIVDGEAIADAKG